MTITELLADELEREAAITRRVLGRVPEGHYDWRPHEKSMTLGRLSTLVATMPSWVCAALDRDFLEMRGEGADYEKQNLRTADLLVAAMDRDTSKARESLSRTNDGHLMTKWQLRVSGRVVSEEPRYAVLRDAVLNHWAHHRGQLTVYLRLLNAPVPSVYGPTADEPAF